MKTYRGAMLLALVGLAGCSCHRQPDAETPVHPAAAEVPPQANAGSAAQIDADAPPRLRQLRAQARLDAANAVQRYLTIWPGHPEDADRMWAGGRPPALREDANLRSLQGLVSMRVRNDLPVALDQEDPPRAMEVPVHVLVQMPDGNHRFNGWYRVRMRIDGDGWELTSASLQPELH